MQYVQTLQGQTLSPAASTEISDPWTRYVSNYQMCSLCLLHKHKHLFDTNFFSFRGILSRITKKRIWIILHSIIPIVSAWVILYFLLKIHVKDAFKLHLSLNIKKRIIVVVKENVFQNMRKFLNWKKYIHCEEDIVLLFKEFYMNGNDIVSVLKEFMT